MKEDIMRKLSIVIMLSFWPLQSRGWAQHHGDEHAGDVTVGFAICVDSSRHLELELDAEEVFELPRVDGVLQGWALDDPGFRSLDEDEPEEGIFALQPGARILLEVVAIDAGLKVHSPGFVSVLDAPGEQWELGSAPFDTHPVWHIQASMNTPMASGDGESLRRVTFVLRDVGVTAYGASREVTLQFKPERPVFSRGDCNSDAVVDLSDPISLLEWLFLGDARPECLAACDVNAEGVIDLSDAIHVLGYLFLGSPAPPPPFGTCGRGNASDTNLGCVGRADNCQRVLLDGPMGNLSIEAVPEEGSVGFIIAGAEVHLFKMPGILDTSINHIGPDGTRAYGFYRDPVEGDHGFELDLITNTFSKLALPGARFTIVRGGHGNKLVGKLADENGTPEDPDDDVRKAFIYDTTTKELDVYTREGYSDIGFTSMNQDGVITGFNDFGTKGFIYKDGTFIDLDVPDAFRLFPFQVNASGQFVGFWGLTADTWFDNSMNPAFVGQFVGSAYSISRYDFPGATGTGLTGIAQDGRIVGLAYSSHQSRPVLFTAASSDALPRVIPLPQNLEPFPVGIDGRGWIFGQLFLHENDQVEVDPQARAILEVAEGIYTEVGRISGPAHAGPLAEVIHAPFHEVDSHGRSLRDHARVLDADAGDREENFSRIHDHLVNEIWIDLRKLESASQEMAAQVQASEHSGTGEAAVVLSAVGSVMGTIPGLREKVAAMAADFQEPVENQKNGVGGPLNPKRLANGNVLVSLSTDNLVAEIAPGGALVWSHPLAYPTEAERLVNGNTLIASRDDGRVVEINESGTILWEYPGEAIYGVDRLLNGNTLLAIQGDPAQLLEISPAREVVWTYGAGNPDLLAPSARRLANGNTLVADNSGYFLGAARVFEITPDGTVVWEYTEGIYGVYGVDRLENGNTLINDQGNGRLIEITPDGQRVWSHGALTLPGGFQVLPEGRLLIAVFGENRYFEITRRTSP